MFLQGAGTLGGLPRLQNEAPQMLTSQFQPESQRYQRHEMVRGVEHIRELLLDFGNRLPKRRSMDNLVSEAIELFKAPAIERVPSDRLGVWCRLADPIDDVNLPEQ